MATSCEYEVLYLKLCIDGKTVIEIDKLAFICRIGDTDHQENIRKNLGAHSADDILTQGEIDAFLKFL